MDRRNFEDAAVTASLERYFNPDAAPAKPLPARFNAFSLPT